MTALILASSRIRGLNNILFKNRIKNFVNWVLVFLQGGVLLPLLWNLVVNLLLRGLEYSGNDAIADAGDIAIAGLGICPQTLSDKLNLALSSVPNWCIDFGLSINASKTDTILFTRSYKIPTFSVPSVCGTRFRLSPDVKYLDLILDPKFNWRANLAARTRKVACAAYCCSRAIGTRWSLRLRIMDWIYSAVIESNLLYSVAFWWTALDRQHNFRLLDKVRRLMAQGSCAGSILWLSNLISYTVLLSGELLWTDNTTSESLTRPKGRWPFI